MMKGLNAVRVRWVKRGDPRPVEAPRRQQPPRRLQRAPVPNRRPQVAPVQREDAPDPTRIENQPPRVDLELLADKLAARLGPRIVQAVQDQVQPLQGTPIRVPFTQSATGDPISGTMQPEETPTFIPAVILDPEAKADIQTKTTKSKGKKVEDAADALRKARKSRKKKK